MTPRDSKKEYVLHGAAAWDEYMRRRSASRQAAFMLPFLKPGMSVLDFGCGQGTITADLAEIVAPGEVLGFDMQEAHIQRAHELAAERALLNLTFKVGDIFEPPCEPESFDLAYANAVLSHLVEPERALRIVFQLLKPGGLIAVRDVGGPNMYTGLGADAWEPFKEVLAATMTSHGLGQRLNRLCRETGFEVLGVSGSIEATPASAWETSIRGLTAHILQRAAEMGIATAEQGTEIIRNIEEEWVSDPDALWFSPWYEVIALKR